METFWRIVKLGHTNFYRNRWLTLGATLLMTLTLTMISISLIISFAIGDTSKKISSKIDLKVYFRDDSVADRDIINLGEKIKRIEGVSEVRFIDKEAALDLWKRFPIKESIKEPVGKDFNPLPRSLEIKTTNPDDIEKVSQEINQLNQDQLICSDCLSYGKNKEVVDRLVASTRTAQQAGWLFSILFGLIAVLNVYNIIRLAITARSDEIEIMRYVGASNAFVRGPFVVEGFLYGFFATIISSALIVGVAALLTAFGKANNLGIVTMAFDLLDANLFQYVLNHLTILIVIQLLVGVIIGVIVSLMSVRKYLNA